MLKCWRAEPEERPTFAWLEDKFKPLIPTQELRNTKRAIEKERFLYGDLNNRGYLDMNRRSSAESDTTNRRNRNETETTEV